MFITFSCETFLRVFFFKFFQENASFSSCCILIVTISKSSQLSKKLLKRLLNESFTKKVCVLYAAGWRKKISLQLWKVFYYRSFLNLFTNFRFCRKHFHINVKFSMCSERILKKYMLKIIYITFSHWQENIGLVVLIMESSGKYFDLGWLKKKGRKYVYKEHEDLYSSLHVVRWIRSRGVSW